MQTPPTPTPYAPRAKSQGKGRRFVIILLFLAALAGAWYMFGRTHAGHVGGPPPVVVQTANVVQQQVPLTIEAVGNVVAYESVAIRSRIDSQVVAVHFKDGDAVKQGDVLFELDDKALKAQAEQLEANVARDRAQLENARRQYARSKSLADTGFATKANLDDTRATLAAAQATVGASVAALNNIKVQLGYTRIVAPISGRTGTINVTLGNTVKANDTTALVTINQVKPIRVQAALPQTAFDAVREALRQGKVAVTALKHEETTSSEALATGALDYIDNAVDQSTGTFITRAGFENADERLWPGMFVTISMTLGEQENALTIPEVAVQHGQTGDYVFVIDGNKATRRDVKVARLQGGNAVIASGLAAQEAVAVDGLLALKDGVVVEVHNPDSASASPDSAKPPVSAEPKK